jgi:hypothetical protein
VSNVPSASTKETSSPCTGEEGKVIVTAAALVSIKMLSPARAVYADVFSIQVEEPVCRSNQLVPSVATLLLLNGNKVIVLPLAPKP